MPTDATGSPTPLGIPKYNVDVDAPSGLGFNGAMDVLDTLIAARMTSPSAPSIGDVPVWNGTAWVKSSSTRMAYSGVAARPSGQWTRAVNQSVLNNNETTLTYAGAEIGPSSIFSMNLGTGALTINEAGWYSVWGMNSWAAAAGANAYVLMSSSDWGIFAFNVVLTTQVSTWLSGLIHASAGSTIVMRAMQFSGGNLNSTLTRFGIVQISKD